MDVGDYMLEELKKYIKNNLVVEKEKKAFFFGAVAKCASNSINYEDCCCSEVNINNYINDNKDLNNFQTLLFKYIDDRNLKDSDVYNKVNIDRRLFSKIRSDSNYHPSKETVILLGLSLELNENEIDKLLESASYSLPKNNHYDLIIRFCFINKIYDIFKVNELLDSYKCKLFI